MTVFELMALAGSVTNGPIRSNGHTMGRVTTHGTQVEYRDRQDKLIGRINRSGSMAIVTDRQGRTIARLDQ